MKKYKQIYRDYFDIAEQENVICESCKFAIAVDIHHIVFRSHGGQDEINNLIGLCRDCHNKAHDNPEFNNSLKEIVKCR